MKLDDNFKDGDLEAIGKLFSDLLDPRLTLADVGISNKTFYDWRRYDVVSPRLEKAEEEGYKNLRFTIYDLIWFKILIDLRQMGIKYSSLKVLRDKVWERLDLAVIPQIFKGPNLESAKKGQPEFAKSIQGVADLMNDELEKTIKESDFAFYAFELLIFSSICDRKRITMLYRFDGYMSYLKDIPELIIDSTPIDFIRHYNENFVPFPHISIPVNKYIDTLIGDYNSIDMLPVLGFINQDEFEVLSFLKRNDLKHVLITKDKGNNQIKEIEYTIDADLSQADYFKLLRTLTLKDYTSISFKSRNNKSVYFEKTVKKKMN